MSLSRGVLIPFAGALVGSTVVGSLMLGVPAEQLLTSVSGSAGAALGWAAGAYFENTYPHSVEKLNVTKTKAGSMAVVYLLPLASSIIVVDLASGTLDSEVIKLAIGATAGGVVTQRFIGTY